ncbi:MAG: acyltransferase family protein [Planctomycetota bacterium]|nr:acyltransferase family protein [Planctomycetota bacterium]
MDAACYESRTLSWIGFCSRHSHALGVILHVTVFFMPAEAHTGFFTWAAGEYHGDVLNYAASHTIHLFRMQLFFIMAGLFAELVIEHKGLTHLVKDRLKRILVPFVVGILVLLPVHSLLINLIGTFSDYHSWYGDHLVDMSFLERVTAVAFFGTFAGEMFQNDGLMHWFLYYLLLI